VNQNGKDTEGSVRNFDLLRVFHNFLEELRKTIMSVRINGFFVDINPEIIEYETDSSYSSFVVVM
jgi:hypothetical protein